MTIHLLLGMRAERLALRYLKQQGLKLIVKNFRCKYGEIDLVMQDQDTLVFVEVRFRKKSDYGTGLESVDSHKQQRIFHTSRYFLQKNFSAKYFNIRFDMIAVDATFKINWIKSAFEVKY